MLADQTKAEVVKEALEGIVREFRREHKQVMVKDFRSFFLFPHKKFLYWILFFKG